MIAKKLTGGIKLWVEGACSAQTRYAPYTMRPRGKGGLSWPTGHALSTRLLPELWILEAIFRDEKWMEVDGRAASRIQGFFSDLCFPRPSIGEWEGEGSIRVAEAIFL